MHAADSFHILFRGSVALRVNRILLRTVKNVAYISVTSHPRFGSMVCAGIASQKGG